MELKTKEVEEKISKVLIPRFSEYVRDRQDLEKQWIKDLRQYRGVYDPEILAMIPPNKSKVYPKETHVKVVGFVAKMMEMMFPASDKNWDVKPSEIPSIPEDALTGIIAKLEGERMEQATIEYQNAVAQAQQAGQPPPPAPQIQPITSEDIEVEVKKFAAQRAKNMSDTIEDQLSDLGGDKLDHPQLCKKVLRSGGIYGYGILKGPQVRFQTERQWVRGIDGRFAAETTKKPRPFYSHCKVWDIYPDLSAKSWRTQDGIFERMVMNRHELILLKSRQDFIGNTITEFVKENPTGNYKVANYETDLNTLNNKGSLKTTSKYEVVRWLGYFDGKTLFEAGVEGITEDDFATDVLADIWMLGERVIKVDTAPFGDNPADSYHVFVFEEDEDSGLTGSGLPLVLRDSQLRLCSIDRATQDNMASCAGPVYEVNDDLISARHPVQDIYAFQVIHREGQGPDAGVPALRAVNTNSHLSELIPLRKEVLETFDRESSLPGWLFGATQQLGEAFRTSNNMSMMTGGANMVTKDVVRAFDVFTQSVIGSMVAWNMEFNADPEIKGDFNVIPKGNISLVAKEVRGAALDQFWLTLDPEEKLRFKEVSVLIERLKSRDLPVDLLEQEAVGEKKVGEFRAAQAAAQQAEADLTGAKTTKLQADAQKSQVDAGNAQQKLNAEIAEIMSRVDQNIAGVKDKQVKNELEHLKVLLGTLQTDLEHKLATTETTAKILSMGDKREQGKGKPATK